MKPPGTYCNSLVVLVALLVIGTSSPAEELRPLHAGLNLSNWLANAERQPMRASDFQQIKAAGFDNIRLPINPEKFGFKLEKDSKGYAATDFTPVDAAIKLARDNGLTVVLDVHCLDHFVKTLENEPAWAEPEFIDLWVNLARRYHDQPTGSVAFELLNEPQYYDAESRYEAFATKLVAAIRAVDPERTLVVGAPHGSGISGLEAIHKLPFENILYAFHYYLPYFFTGQGTPSGFDGTMIAAFRNVPYPSSLVNQPASFYAPKASDPAMAERNLKEYVDANWNADHIAAQIAEATKWAEANKVQLVCGEFGVTRPCSDPASRYRWIRDVREVLEKNHIGWQMWDYTDLYGLTQLQPASNPDPGDNSVVLTDPVNGTRTFEAEGLQALGMDASAVKTVSAGK